MSTAPESPQLEQQWRARFRRLVLYVLAALVLVMSAGFLLMQTPWFANLVRGKLIDALSTATGGRVEIASFAWHPMNLKAEVTGLTIHGLEAPGEVPYAHVDRLALEVKVISLLRGRVGLSWLDVDHPVFHLIVYPDGSTNQPVPKHMTEGGKPVTDTLFELEADRAQVNDGLVLINQRALPFNLAANHVSVTVTYRRHPESYLGALRIDDLTAERGKAQAVHSRLELNLDLGRKALKLDGLHFVSGASKLDASGSLEDFTKMNWLLAAKGSVDLREVAALTGVDGLGPGDLGLDLFGQGNMAQGGAAIFTVTGNIRLKNASYHDADLLLRDINATSSLRATEDMITLPDLKIRLLQGGVDANVKVMNYLAASATPQPKPAKMAVAQQQGTIHARLYGIRPATVFEVIELGTYQNLGFDTQADGTADVTWKGSPEDLVASAKVALTPPRTAMPHTVPVAGMVDAAYAVRGGVLTARQVDVRTPASTLTASGRTSFAPLTGATALKVDFTTDNLNEFDRALTVFGVKANGKRGVAAIPVELHGKAEFHGQVSGSLNTPDVQGHLSAKDFSTAIDTAATDGTLPQTPPLPGMRQTVRWDELEMETRYTPTLISVNHLLLTRSPTAHAMTVIRGSGELHAARDRRRQPVFNEHSTLDAQAHIADASVTDLLSIAGQSLPVTGTVNLNAHATGALDALDGGGHVSVDGGEIYGESYTSLNADLRFAGQSAKATNLVFLMDGGRIAGEGAYNIDTQSFEASAQGTGFALEHIRRLENAEYQVGGMAAFDLHASGTRDVPQGTAHVTLNNLTLNGQSAGKVQAEAHTSGRTLLVNATSTLAQAELRLAGQMALGGEYPVQAKLNFDHLDFAPVLKLLDVEGVRGNSDLAGVIDISGPAKAPKQMAGTAAIDRFRATLQGLPLTSKGPIHASLREGVVSLDQMEIDAQDTDLIAGGTVDLMGKAGLNLQAHGDINAKLAQSFSPEVSSSGHIDFHMTAMGPLKQPNLDGQFNFNNVNLAWQELPNGISRLNGAMVFNQNRLELRNLTGTTGGGTVALTGSLVYQHGVYGDVTATLQNTRFRYAGLSSTADAKIRLQGTGDSMLVSGRVQIMRFLVGSNVDFAALAGSSAVAPPPDPNAFGNRVRLDVHVTSAPQMDFQNSFAQIAGSVDLRIRGTVAQPAVLGRINITDGKATYNGTTYQLQHGDIYFTNPVKIEPVIDLDATTRIEEYDVTIGLQGTADRLTPTFRSEPPLPEADVISLLTQGRTQEEQSIYNTQQQQAGVNGTANAVLSSALNATVSNRIQKLFGVGSVKIDPTYTGSLGQSSARITVTQNIGQQVLLTYATSVNSTTQQLIQAQVNLSPTFSVTARRDEADVFSLIFKVHKRYR